MTVTAEIHAECPVEPAAAKKVKLTSDKSGAITSVSESLNMSDRGFTEYSAMVAKMSE